MVEDIQQLKDDKIRYLNKLLPQDENGYFLDISNQKVSYGNNPQLSYINTKLPLKEEHIIEIQKCSTDIIYFVESYVKIRSLDEGLVYPDLRDYQKELIQQYYENRFNIVLAGRQSGKSVTTLLYILWKLCFCPDTIVGICANKFTMAAENLQRLMDMYADLPIWLKPSVKVYNKESFVNEIGCKAYISATTPDAFRGLSINLIFIDECVAGDTKITVRNKKTGVIEDITMEELYNRIG
ncbi:putative large terminase [Campylobacter phage vB_Cj_QDYZ]|uniref:Large terminase n=1 Tax=Campylobacter phage vB_Cj_QDYZ TaxID=3032374 RepID=A0AAF0GBI7_9CAUD|nr:putative large terminase [Campylobacter phage vB_Cj_QDYZ]